MPSGLSPSESGSIGKAPSEDRKAPVDKDVDRGEAPKDDQLHPDAAKDADRLSPDTRKDQQPGKPDEKPEKGSMIPALAAAAIAVPVAAALANKARKKSPEKVNEDKIPIKIPGEDQLKDDSSKQGEPVGGAPSKDQPTAAVQPASADSGTSPKSEPSSIGSSVISPDSSAGPRSATTPASGELAAEAKKPTDKAGKPADQFVSMPKSDKQKKACSLSPKDFKQLGKLAKPKDGGSPKS